MQSSCVECCVKLLEFAHTSACVCVSCFCASDAHDFFAECFIGCRRSIRRRRVTATRELQHDTSLRKFFVLGCACSRHVTRNMVGSASVNDGRSGQSDHRGKKALARVTFTPAVIIGTLFTPLILRFCVRQRFADPMRIRINMKKKTSNAD